MHTQLHQLCALKVRLPLPNCYRNLRYIEYHSNINAHVFHLGIDSHSALNIKTRPFVRSTSTTTPESNYRQNYEVAGFHVSSQQGLFPLTATMHSQHYLGTTQGQRPAVPADWPQREGQNNDRYGDRRRTGAKWRGGTKPGVGPLLQSFQAKPQPIQSHSIAVSVMMSNWAKRKIDELNLFFFVIMPNRNCLYPKPSTWDRQSKT